MLSPTMTRCPPPTGSTPPPRSLASWLTSRGLGRTQDETTACIPHDIYVIGTQENSLGDREWVEFLRASLKTLMAIDYRVVMSGRSLDTSGQSRLPAAIAPGLLPPNPGPSPTPNAAQGISYAPWTPWRERPPQEPPFGDGLAHLAAALPPPSPRRSPCNASGASRSWCW